MPRLINVSIISDRISCRESVGGTEAPPSTGRGARLAALVTAALLLIATAVVSTLGNVRGLHVGIAAAAPLNSQALEFLREHELEGNVFNSYEYGDQLVYHFWPRVHVAMDTRLDAYGASYYHEHQRLSGRLQFRLDNADELIDFLDRHRVDVIVSYPFDVKNWLRTGYAERLAEAGFLAIYRDNTTTILERRSGSS